MTSYGSMKTSSGVFPVVMPNQSTYHRNNRYSSQHTSSSVSKMDFSYIGSEFQNMSNSFIVAGQRLFGTSNYERENSWGAQGQTFPISKAKLSTVPSNHTANQSAGVDGLDPAKKSGKGVKLLGTYQAMFMLFSTAMGGGILGLPKVLGFNGALLGALMLTLGALFSAISQYLLLQEMRDANLEIKENNRLDGTNRKPIEMYSELLDYAVKKRYPWVTGSIVPVATSWLIVIYNFGVSLITYMKFMLVFIPELLVLLLPKTVSSILTVGSGDSLEVSWTFTGLLFIPYFLMCVPKDVSVLRYVAVYPLIAIIIIGVYVVVQFFMKISGDDAEVDHMVHVDGREFPQFMMSEQMEEWAEENLLGGSTSSAASSSSSSSVVAGMSVSGVEDEIDAESSTEYPLFNFSLFLFASIGKFMFAYFCHNNVVVVATEITEPTDKNLAKIAFYNVTMVATIYVLVSLCVFFTFGTAVDALFIENYETNWASICIRVLIVFEVFLSVPMNFLSMRSGVLMLFNHYTGADSAAAEESATAEEQVALTAAAEDQAVVIKRSSRQQTASARSSSRMSRSSDASSRATSVANSSLGVVDAQNNNNNSRRRQSSCSQKSEEEEDYDQKSTNHGASTVVSAGAYNKTRIIGRSFGAASTASNSSQKAKAEMSCTQQWVSTFVILASALTVAKTLDKPTMVVDYLGLLIAPLLMLVFPAFISMQVLPKVWYRKFVAMALYMWASCAFIGFFFKVYIDFIQ